MRSIWNGAIGFGLVNIPVKLFSASEDSKLDLDMLDKSDHANIKFKRVNEDTGKEVEWENIVKAYNLDGEYVVLDDEDFEKVSPEKNKILSIQQFVSVDEIDSVYFEKPYFLTPQKNGEQAYQLLLHALKESKMAGIGTFILREKELLGIVKPYKNKVLIVNRMRFPEEIREIDKLDLPASKKPTKEELKMAKMLIDQLKGKFDPSLYKNEYAESLLKIIKAKAKGTTPKIKEVEKKPKKSVDLMAQLKASLKANKDKKAS